MDWDRFEESVSAAMTRHMVTRNLASVWAPEQPLPFVATLVAFARERGFTEWLDERACLIDDPSFRSGEKLLKGGWEVRKLVGFDWSSGGATSCHSSLVALRTPGGREFVGLDSDELHPFQLIAALVPMASRVGHSIFFKDLIRENGARYGLELFGSLPTYTEVYAPRVIPNDAIGPAYYDWMEWASRTGWDSWLELQATVMERVAARRANGDHDGGTASALTGAGDGVPDDGLDYRPLDQGDEEFGLSEPEKTRVLFTYIQMSVLNSFYKRSRRPR